MKDLGVSLGPSVMEDSNILKTEENLNFYNNYNNTISRDINQQIGDNLQNRNDSLSRFDKTNYRNQGPTNQVQIQSNDKPNNQTQGNFTSFQIRNPNNDNNQNINNNSNNKYGINYMSQEAQPQQQPQPQPQPQPSYKGYGSDEDHQRKRGYGNELEENSRKKFYNNEVNKNINTSTNEDSDDAILKIKKKTLFNDFPMINIKHFNGKGNSFEANVKLLKTSYEEKNELLEKNLEYYKALLENYFKKKIHKARNSQLENFEDHFPIINITTEHNDLLKLLREIYESKLKELEKVRFRCLTINFLELYDSIKESYRA